MNRLVVLGFVTAAMALSALDAASGATHATREFNFEAAKVRLVERDGAVSVDYPEAISTAAPGMPDLPTRVAWIEVPSGYRVTRVEVESLETESLGTHRLAPAPADRQIDEAPTTVQLASDLQGLQPGSWAEVGAQGSMRGHRLTALHVHPVRWDARSGELLVARQLRLRYELEPDPDAVPLARNRIVPDVEQRFERSLANLLPDYQSLAPLGGGSQIAGEGPYQPTFRPTTDGSPVEYVIVTKAALESEFQRLADWKTQKGVQAAVRTVEWIDEKYPNGADRAERIRFFLKDAYQNWGTLFVLLGGDTDVIPARYVYITSPQLETIPSDMYYSCLEGNWNGDHDAKWAEGQTISSPGDDADLLFELSVGRAPVSTVVQAQQFVDKILLYEIDAPTDANYPASALALAERLFPASHGADKAEDAFAMLPPWFKQVKLYEESASYPGSLELTKEAAIDSINNGFGLVLHVGHGYRNTMSVADGTINNPDVDGLTNAPRNSIVFAINCSSVSIDFNSIGERWLKNPNGGSVIYIGTSRLAFVTASTLYQLDWFEEVFINSTTTMGLATDIARLVLASNGTFDGAARWNLVSTILLGDPELDLYMDQIAPLAVSHPASIQVGQGSVAVTVSSGGSPVADATVTLWKDGEAYAAGTTDALGAITLDFEPETTGTAQLTVHKTFYRVYEAELPVNATAQPFPHISALTIDDDTSGASSGDADGFADAGETIELSITIKNGGGSSISFSNGILSVVDDPQNAITINTASVNYGTIAAGGSSAGAGSYVITIDAAAPEASQPLLQLNITATQGNWSDVLVLPIRRPYIEHYEHTIDDALPRGNGNGIVDAGEEIWYTIKLRNAGRHQLDQVTATLEALRASDQQPNPLVTVLDDSATWGPLAEGQIASGDRFEFLLDGAADPSDVLLRITFASPPFANVVQLTDVIGPGAPDSIRTFGSPSTITLQWFPPGDGDVRGYDVYRSTSILGPYTRINEYTVDGAATYEDAGLPALTRFYYQVVGRDSSFNTGTFSPIISATTNPPLHSGWPNEMAQPSSVSPTVADLDGDYTMEILAAAEMQYAWNSGGTEVADGDDDDRTNGPLSLLGKSNDKGFGATQAIGDMDGDGFLEVANVGWTNDSLFVWNRRGESLPGFPKPVLDDFNWASPIMVDLDLDGDLEVIVWTAKGGRLFAWHHDGTEFVDGDNDPATDGLMTPRIFGTSFNYGTPAVGNLDGDPQPEVVVTINFSDDNSGGVYAINNDGSYVPGWPVFTGDAGATSQVSSAPAIADLDQDGDMEVVISAERDGGRIYVFNHDGSNFPNFPVEAAAATSTDRLPSPTLGDVDRDTFLDIVFPATDGQLWAWDRFGAPLTGFPVQFNDIPSQNTQCTAVIGNVDSDNDVEILFGDEDGKVHAYNHDGTAVAGFPIQTNGEIRGTPAVWDVDQDNLVEVVAVSFDTNVYVWDLPFDFRPDLSPWPMFGHDTRNTNLSSSAIMQIGIADPGPAASPVAFHAALHPAVPNPFNPRTRLTFDVPGEANAARQVELAIYDVSGRQVRSLVSGAVETGRHTVTWDGRADRGGAAPSGVYFAQLRVGDSVATQKLVMLR